MPQSWQCGAQLAVPCNLRLRRGREWGRWQGGTLLACSSLRLQVHCNTRPAFFGPRVGALSLSMSAQHSRAPTFGS